MATKTTTAQTALSASLSAQTPGPIVEVQLMPLTRQARDADSPQAPRKHTKVQKDNQEYLAFARRMLRAYGRRVMAEDPSTLAELMTLAAELDDVITRSARSLHDQGWSWGEIGEETGLSRGAARKRWAAAEESE